MSEEKLKPCPFCGKEPVYVADGKVICCCGVMMKSFNDWNPFTNQEAVDRWNERVVDANKTITCFKCHGAGVFGVPYLDDNGEWDGRLDVRKCEVCGHTGKITLAWYEELQKGARGDKE